MTQPALLRFGGMIGMIRDSRRRSDGRRSIRALGAELAIPQRVSHSFRFSRLSAVMTFSRRAFRNQSI